MVRRIGFGHEEGPFGGTVRRSRDAVPATPAKAAPPRAAPVPGLPVTGTAQPANRTGPPGRTGRVIATLILMLLLGFAGIFGYVLTVSLDSPEAADATVRRALLAAITVTLVIWLVILRLILRRLAGR